MAEHMRHKTDIAVLKSNLKHEVDKLNKIIDLRFVYQDKALQINTIEILRRLDNLNGEAERLQRMQSTYVSESLYTVEHNNIRDKIDRLEEAMNKSTGRNSVFITIISASVALISSIAAILVAHYLGVN